MNVAYALGYVPRFEGWEYLYVFIVGWSALITFAGLLFDSMRQERAIKHYYRFHWMAYCVVALGIFSLFPFGLMCLFAVNIAFQCFAPMGASVIAAMFSILGVASFVYNMFGEEFWKAVKQAR